MLPVSQIHEFYDKDKGIKMNRIPEVKIEDVIEYSKGQPKGFKKPAVKELTITQDGIEFKVKYKLTSKYSALWKNYYQIREEHSFYDPAVALERARMNDGYIEKVVDAYEEYADRFCTEEYEVACAARKEYGDDELDFEREQDKYIEAHRIPDAEINKIRREMIDIMRNDLS